MAPQYYRGSSSCLECPSDTSQAVVVTAVAFFACPRTGKCLLASGQSDRTLRVWDALKGGDYLQQDVLPDKIRAIAPSFDGVHLAVSLGMMYDPDRAAVGCWLSA